jgi:hypothetical protein
VTDDEHTKIRVVVVLLPDHHDGDACNPFFMALFGITSHAYCSVCIVIHKTRRLPASFHFLCSTSAKHPAVTANRGVRAVGCVEEAFPNACYPEFHAQILITDNMQHFLRLRTSSTGLISHELLRATSCTADSCSLCEIYPDTWGFGAFATSCKT